MIEAKHSKIARMIFTPYVERLIRKSFTNFYLLNEISEIPDDKSLLITPNHISWWDGFFIDYISRRFIKKKVHLMMLEETLRKYWFFNNLGAYSINPSNNKSVIDSAVYTRKILDDPGNFVVTYPQGEIESFEKRPLAIKHGIRILIKENPEQTKILPIGFKIEYFKERNPAVICRFGRLLNGEEVTENIKAFEDEFIGNLDKINEAIFNKELGRDLMK